MEIHKLRGTEFLVDLESDYKKNLVETGLGYLLLFQQPEKLALKMFHPPIGLEKQDRSNNFWPHGLNNKSLVFLIK